MGPRRRKDPGLGSLADEDLMQHVSRGDARAFETVYDRHADVAFALAYRISGTRAKAEDVVQEAFLAVWRSGARYDSARGSVRTWILGIVHNRAIDSLRRHLVHDRRRGGDEELAERMPAAEHTEAEAVRRTEAGTVRRAMAGLPPDQKRVVELAYFGGFSHSEIAEILAAPVGTVKGRMRLALAKLRTALEDEEVTQA